MKISYGAGLFILFIASQCVGGDKGPAPLDVVNMRMNAYNEHNIEAFLATYSDKIEIFTFPNKSLGKGKDHLRKIFEPMFKQGMVQVTLHSQINKDGYVVNHETVDDDGRETEYISIYEVRKGLIQSVVFVRD